jgi:hypothetical protein
MYIGIDTELLINSKITPNQLVVGRLISNRQFITLLDLIDAGVITESGFHRAVDGLVSKKLFANTSPQGEYDFNLITPLDSFLKLVARGDKFEELAALFPSVVTRPDGSSDYLKVDLAKSKREYEKLVKKDLALHNHILKCLAYEINLREKENKLMYMKRLPNWITSEEWKSYEERMQTQPLSTMPKGGDLGYGTQLE